MKNFILAEPQSLEQVCSFLPKESGKYFVMAGGTDLLAEIKDEIVEPEVVVDLKTIPNLSYIKKEKDGLHIGALTTIAELAEDLSVKQDYRALYEAAKEVGTPQLRNVGTISGNLCQRPRCWYYRDPQVQCRKKGGSRCFAFRGRNKYHAILGGGICYIVHPSDLAPALIALEAKVSILSPNGEKTIPLEELYALPSKNVQKETILKSNEVIKEVILPPLKKGEKSTYSKFKERGTWDFAVVSVAMKGTASGKAFNEVKIVIGGVAPIPWRLFAAEAMIKGKTVTEKLVRQAAREALKDANPLEENGYKLELVEVILYKTALSLI